VRRAAIIGACIASWALLAALGLHFWLQGDRLPAAVLFGAIPLDAAVLVLLLLRLRRTDG
jgi:hypothetical protein